MWILIHVNFLLTFKNTSIFLEILTRIFHFKNIMELTKATHKLESLSQETRLKAFRLLVKAGGEGISAGEISKKLKVPANTLSFHLTHLTNAGLIVSKREGRSIIYSVNFEEVESLIRFLLEKCCTDSDHISCMTESTKNYIDSIFTNSSLKDKS